MPRVYFDWQPVQDELVRFAPIAAAALGGSGGRVAGAMLANRLRVDPTPAAVLAAVASDPKAEAKIAEAEAEIAALPLDVPEPDLASVASTRQRTLGHWMAPTVTMFLMISSIVFMYLVFSAEFPERNEPLVYTAFGTLLGWASSAVAYWIGSSRGSAESRQGLVDTVEAAARPRRI